MTKTVPSWSPRPSQSAHSHLIHALDGELERHQYANLALLEGNLDATRLMPIADLQQVQQHREQDLLLTIVCRPGGCRTPSSAAGRGSRYFVSAMLAPKDIRPSPSAAPRQRSAIHSSGIYRMHAHCPADSAPSQPPTSRNRAWGKAVPSHATLPEKQIRHATTGV